MAIHNSETLLRSYHNAMNCIASNNYEALAQALVTHEDIFEKYEGFDTLYDGPNILMTARCIVSRAKVLIKIVKLNANGFREILSHRLASKLTPENVVPLQAVYKIREQLCLVMPFVSGGDLLAYLDPLSECLARDVFKQVCHVIYNLHMHGIVHRDIKPENVLVSGNLNSGGPARIFVADYGFTCHPEHSIGIYGTKNYLAPEWFPTHMRPPVKFYDKGRSCSETCAQIRTKSNARRICCLDQTRDHEIPLSGLRRCKSNCELSNDIWSLGVLLWIMVYGELPWPYDQPEKCCCEPPMTPSNITISDDLKNLLMWMLSKNPVFRPSIVQIMNHKWMS